MVSQSCDARPSLWAPAWPEVVVVLAIAAALAVCVPTPGQAQMAGCTSSAGGAGQTVVRCRSVTIEVARGAEAGLIDDNGDGEPDAVALKTGAVLIDYQPSRAGGFQVQTPHAIASVRGTTWAVDVTAPQSAVFVADGRVAVTRVTGARGVVLTAGQGVDVRPGTAPLVVNRWEAPRVRALLSRFGR